LHREGKPRFEATAEAARLRLRPILMTSFAFILGVLPLVFAHGAGAEMRWSLGTAVFSGMLGVTLFGIFLTPVFFYVLQGMSEWRFFTSAVARRVGSPLMGALTGFAVGFLLSRLTHQPASREALFAATGAAFGVLLVIAIQRLANHRSLAQGPPQSPPQGQPPSSPDQTPPDASDERDHS
jgi:multidrug efflux pump